VPCPHCGEYQHLQWANLQYPEGKPESARYACEHCGALIEEREKTAMLERGEWRATFPERTTVGFHLNALYSPIGLGRSWAWLAARFEEVKRDPARLKVFVNTRLGECYEDPDERLDWEELKNRAEPVRAARDPARLPGAHRRRRRAEGPPRSPGGRLGPQRAAG
jgi:phage terminase large subunit GpA-like protein